MKLTTLSFLVLFAILPETSRGEADRDGHLNLLVAAPTAIAITVAR